MSVTWKVLGMTVAGVAVIALYISASVFGALANAGMFGGVNPMRFMIYVGLGLTATWLATIMYLTSTGSGEA